MPAGASLSGATVTETLALWVLKAVVPPVPAVLTLALPPLVPVVPSQARMVRSATTWPCQSAAGTKRSRLFPPESATSRRALALSGVPRSVQLEPLFTLYCHRPLVLPALMMAMPCCKAVPSGSVSRPATRVLTAMPAGLVASSSTSVRAKGERSGMVGASFAAVTFTVNVRGLEGALASSVSAIVKALDVRVGAWSTLSYRRASRSASACTTVIAAPAAPVKVIVRVLPETATVYW